MRFGKPNAQYMSQTVYRLNGKKRSEVLYGPQRGLDVSVVRLGRGKVMVATSDPLSYIPQVGPEASAWLSIHLLASDLTTTGFSPAYGLFDFNLPPSMRDSQFATFWKAFHNESKKLGISIIGGHTGKYPGIDYSVIGGGVLVATGPEKSYLTSSMANSGDDVILTKGAAIETTAVLTRAFPRRVRKALGPELFALAWNYLGKTSTVRDALTASSIGVRRDGVTAMHDATEGGVVAGMIELASASDLGMILDLESIPISQETRVLCDHFRIDPMVSLSEGSLIIATRPAKTDKIRSKLTSAGIPSSVVGKLTSKFRGCKTVTGRGLRSISYPDFDPYWKAYSKGIERGWL
ncbi:MAG TPA: AIR synthase family protein [Candidatus Sulfotelmatobacter sp.]|nr:AIR synthase family protein [Candidatus Sulfotelmatobacter sp.]